MIRKIKDLIKNDTVLLIATLLAIVSSIIITPDLEYLDYINYRVLAILMGLMIVMAGFKRMGVFTAVARGLLKLTGSVHSSSMVLVMLCFFFSMAITNDVALISFVPLTLEMLRLLKREDLAIRIVALQTVAANLGSMATPIGNPQNLYLYDLMGVSFGAFIKLMIVPTLLSLVFLVVAILFSIKNEKLETSNINKASKIPTVKLVAFIALFGINVLTVLGIVSFYVSLLITIIVAVILDRGALFIDYALLLTFFMFFVFIGNMQRIESIVTMLNTLVAGKELEVGILFSQVISNVPAAMLLSPFAESLQGLLYGVSLGGLGTLIASMASLISYKYIARSESSKISSSKYLFYFTIVCIIFLIPLYVVVKFLM
ncbi:MAG: citrate transporter [Saccharofermentans sp.]|nr:citrate transporter [Saccharofermentans sp.]